jgi:hypothetical protein
MFSVLATAAFASVAHAEDKAAKGGAITIEVRIQSRAPRPQVATEISRVTPAQHLSEVKQPLLDRVEKAPF